LREESCDYQKAWEPQMTAAEALGNTIMFVVFIASAILGFYFTNRKMKKQKKPVS
jgi:preprotein translocase subunit YajC